MCTAWISAATSGLVIPYIILFYAGTGGMIRVAGLAGRAWHNVAVSSFLM